MSNNMDDGVISLDMNDELCPTIWMMGIISVDMDDGVISLDMDDRVISLDMDDKLCPTI